MQSENPYITPVTDDELDSFLAKYAHSATNVLRCGTGQAGIVRYLHHVEGFSEEDATRLSYPLFDKAKSCLRRTQVPKMIFAIFLLIIGIAGPIVLYFLDYGFVVISGLPIIAGWALLNSVIKPLPLD